MLDDNNLHGNISSNNITGKTQSNNISQTILNNNNLSGDTSSENITGKTEKPNLFGKIINKLLGLDFIWQGTSLGVKKESDDEYSFADLQGPQGQQGIPRGTRKSTELTGRDGIDGHTPEKGVDYFTPNDISEIQKPITEQYNSTETYSVGDYCIYENTLFKCIEAITIPESFDTNKWISTSIFNETILLRQALVPQGGVAGQILAKKTNADNDVEWVNGEKDLIFVRTSADISSTTNLTNISNWEEVEKIGNAFSLENGVIKIGPNVNKIKVYCKIMLYHSNNYNNDYNGYLRHNQSNIKESWILKTVSGVVFDVVTTGATISVSENDTITFAHSGSNFGLNKNSTTLLIEKIN